MKVPSIRQWMLHLQPLQVPLTLSSHGTIRCQITSEGNTMTHPSRQTNWLLIEFNFKKPRVVQSSWLTWQILNLPSKISKTGRKKKSFGQGLFSELTPYTNKNTNIVVVCCKWNQRDAVQQVFYCTLAGSTCFGCRRHPSSGAQYVQSRSVGTTCCNSINIL